MYNFKYITIDNIEFMCFDTGHVFKYDDDMDEFVYIYNVGKGPYKHIQIRLNNTRNYYLHRIIYAAFNKDFNIYDKTKIIDHINGIGDDNRLCNLRLCSFSQNNCNVEPYRENKTGHKNIGIIIRKYKNNVKWLYNIVIQYQYKKYSKSIKPLCDNIGHPNETQIKNIPDYVIEERNRLLRQYHKEFIRV